MERKSYPEAKRRIIIKLSTADFVRFLEEVTDQKGKLFIQNRLLQRRVPGFRDGRAPLTRTVPQLITKLKSEPELTNPDSVAWNSFADIWMYWVKSHQELDNALTAFNNGGDFDENHNCIKPPNSELDIECFKFLLEASRNTAIHQEVVNRFYEYGYFNEDERIQNLINQMPSCEEIEQREQLAELPDKVDELFQAIDRLSQDITDINSRISAMESPNGLEQELTEQIAKARQDFDTGLQNLEQTIIDKHNQFDNQISSIESRFTQLVDLMNRISSLESSFSELQGSINSFENKLTEIQSLNVQEISQLVDQRVPDGIKQLDSRILEEIGTLEAKLNAVENTISEIKSKMTDEPRITVQALKLAEWYKTELKGKTERYRNENDYLGDFCYRLRRFGVTDSKDEETAAAIHIALKAFPAIEIADPRIIKVWELMCDNHFYDITINVEMGWLGLQDWFPELFAEECFGIRLERVELEVSIEKMLEVGDMPWVICFCNCDKSFPEAYLPGFLDWVNSFHKGFIKVFLIRCSGTNRCQTNEDFYERVARLPKPKNPHPLRSPNLKPSRIPLTLSEWKFWCQPNSESDSQCEKYHDFLQELRLTVEKLTVENRGFQIPINLLQEIQRYLQLSHNIMAVDRAFDWALTLRLLPWIGNQHRLIDAVLNLVNNGHEELPRFQEELQIARETDK